MVRFVLAFLIATLSFSFSLTPSEEKQLLRDITEIKATLKTFMEQTDKRFKELREDMNKRFEQVDKRFEQVNRELDRLVNIMVGIFAGQIALVVAVIGFAYWDRRTIIRKAREDTVEYLEREGKLRKLIEALREKAKTDKELEAILRKYGLM